MGMYTQLILNCELKKDIPEDVFEALKWMIKQNSKYSEEESLEEIIPHPLFECSRARYMLTMDSYYFDAQTDSTLTKDRWSESYYLDIRCNLKNYEYEIEKFIDWIMPYLEGYEDKFLGFHRYEEFEIPKLIIWEDRSK